MTDREKLIELICFGAHKTETCNSHKDCLPSLGDCGFCTIMADHLLDNGVTFATGTNVGGKWKPASEPPEKPMEYIVMIKGGANATTLLFDGRLWFEEDSEGWRTYYTITHWMPLPEPPDGACRHLSVSLEADSSPQGEPVEGRIATAPAELRNDREGGADDV